MDKWIGWKRSNSVVYKEYCGRRSLPSLPSVPLTLWPKWWTDSKAVKHHSVILFQVANRTFRLPGNRYHQASVKSLCRRGLLLLYQHAKVSRADKDASGPTNYYRRKDWSEAGDSGIWCTSVHRIYSGGKPRLVVGWRRYWFYHTWLQSCQCAW